MLYRILHENNLNEGWEFDPETNVIKWKRFDDKGRTFDDYKIIHNPEWELIAPDNENLPKYRNAKRVTSLDDIESPVLGQVVKLVRGRGRYPRTNKETGYYKFRSQDEIIRNADTRILDDNKRRNVKIRVLPLTGIESYHFIGLPSFDLTKSMKHGYIERGQHRYKEQIPVTFDRESLIDFVEYMQKNVWHFLKSYKTSNGQLGLLPIDYIVTPSTSSSLNEILAKRLSKISGAEYLPNIFEKNLKGMTLNQDILKERANDYVRGFFGDELSDDDLERIRVTVEKGCSDINMSFNKEKNKAIAREILKEIETLHNSSDTQTEAEIKLEKEFDDIVHKIYKRANMSDFYVKDPNNKKEYIRANSADVSGFQIKKLHQVARAALRNLFKFSDDFIREHKWTDKHGVEHKTVLSPVDILKGKRVLVVDDNYSTGASMDSVCQLLMDSGVAKSDIIPITLGCVSKAYAGGGIDSLDPTSKM